MDLDHLHKLVVAACDEADAINGDGPEWVKLLEYLNEAHADPAHSRVAYGVVANVNELLQKTEAQREILAESLRRAIAALEALAADPNNKSEITPDIHALRSDLEYATTPVSVSGSVG